MFRTGERQIEKEEKKNFKIRELLVAGDDRPQIEYAMEKMMHIY